MQFKRPPDIVLGVLLMTGAALSFSSMHALIRIASEDMHAFEVAFFRWVFGFLFLVPLIIRTGPKIWHTASLKRHIFRALSTTAATLAWFWSLVLMPLAEATALNFTIPLFTTIAAALFLGERVGPRRWTATLIGFAGVLVILQPGAAQIQPAAALPIISAIFVAINLNIIKIASRTDSTQTIVLYNALLSIPLTAVPLIWVWSVPSLYSLALLAVLGSLATVAHLMLTKAFTYGDASALVPVDYLRLPFVAVIGFIVFAEVPTVWTWVGGAIIAASTLYIAHREAALARTRATPPATLGPKPPEPM